MKHLPPLSVVAVVAATVAAWCAESDLAACYDFDEGAGAVLHDRSGNGNDGRLHNAKWVKQGRGYCLELNGVDSYVDCGDGPSLDVQDVVSLEAWVYPSRRVSEEPGILGKHFSSYLLTDYKDGQCWWYIGEGGNNAKAPLTVGGWHHVVATFDGESMKLYLDGRLASSHPSRHKSINRGGRFFLGCVMGEPNATDPAYTHTAHFPGRIDEVSVWHCALTAEAVKARFAAGVRKLSLVAPFQPVAARATLREGNTVLKVGASGGVQVAAGAEACVVGSSFSYPGKAIGNNFLGGRRAGGERNWHPAVKRLSDRSVEVRAHGAFYALRRTVTLQPDQVLFEDELTNLRDVPTGVIVQNRLVAPESFEESFTVGGAENPTLFLRRRNTGLGVLLEDNVSRLQFEPCLGLPANQAKFRVGSFALGARKRYPFRWTLYLLPRGEGYFDFINRVRRDWHTNLTLKGPFSCFDVGGMSALLDDPSALKAYLKRKHLKIVVLSPWLDYDPGSFDRIWSRKEYKERMQQAIRAFRQVDPTIKVVGAIETDWVTIDPARIQGGDGLPQAVAGQPRPSGRLTPELTKVIDDANLPWRDSVKRDANGTLKLELYTRGDKPQTALSVYPAVGNYQYEFLLGQVRFLLDEVGCDGFYIDEFSQGWRGGSCGPLSPTSATAWSTTTTSCATFPKQARAAASTVPSTTCFHSRQSRCTRAGSRGRSGP